MGRLFDPAPQFDDANGEPLASGTLTFYLTGTSTLRDTYNSSALTTPNANPITLNSAGRSPVEIWLNDDAAYRVVLKDVLNTVIWDRDPIFSVTASTQVATITALRGITGTGSQTVYLASYATPGDKGQGYFHWDSSSSATDNGGTIIKPTAVVGSGRWIRDYDGPVNIRWFGAKGDGVTDDTTAIQAAIVAANNNDSAGDGPGGHTCASNGTYLTGKVGCRGNLLTGESMEGTIFKAKSGATGTLLDAALDRDGSTANTDGGFGSFENLSVDGNSESVNGIRTYGSQCFVKDVMVHGCVDGVTAGLPIMTRWENVQSYDNTGIGFKTYAAVAQTSTSLFGINCWSYSNDGKGFDIKQVLYSKFVSCAAQDNTGINWNLEGNSNGEGVNYSIMLDNCGSEGGTAEPFYIKNQREIILNTPRVISPPATKNFITFDNSQGTIISYSPVAAPGAGKYGLSVINDSTGITRPIVLVGGNSSGNVTTDAPTKIATYGTASLSGTTIAQAKQLTATATWDPPSINDGAVYAVDVTVTGAEVGDSAVASVSTILNAAWLISAHVRAADTAYVVIMNKTGAPVDLGSGTVRVDVFKH